MDPVDALDAPPIREGAAPTISVSGVGFNSLAGHQPGWVRLTEALVRWLRGHFSVASRIEYPDLVGRVWTSNREQSPIQICSLAEWNPTESNKRPAILVDRLDQERDLAHQAIGDQWQGVRPGNYWILKTGQHVVYCVGGREGEADLLAAEVERELVRFGPIAQQYLCLMRFRPVKTGRRVQIPEYREHYASPIVCIYAYQDMFRIFPVDEEAIAAIKAVVTAS